MAGSVVLPSDRSLADELASSRRAAPRIFVLLVDGADGPADAALPPTAGAGLLPSDRSRPVEFASRRLEPLARFTRLVAAADDSGPAIRPTPADGPLVSDKSLSVEFAESRLAGLRRFIRLLDDAEGPEAEAPAAAFAMLSDCATATPLTPITANTDRVNKALMIMESPSS